MSLAAIVFIVMAVLMTAAGTITYIGSRKTDREHNTTP